jgi:NitT/TauT family transport system substrate-binding protein
MHWLLAATLLVAVLAGGCGSGENTAPAKPGSAKPETSKSDTAKPEAAKAESAKPAKQIVLRMGHFPNVTHAQGVVAHYWSDQGKLPDKKSNMSDQGKGWFEERLGPDVKIEWYVYNAGPSAMEGILTKSLDVTYVGPNPALNTYLKSKGEEIRVIAGAATGGAALVVHEGGAIAKPEDFRGKKVATPQFGNTQDVSCRAWLTNQGFKITQAGGDVSVIPTNNPDQLPLFMKGDLDGVWTVEPWVSILEMQGNGKAFFEETDSLTTVLTCSAAFLKDQPDLAKKVVAANRELTEWINAHPEEAQKMVTEEVGALTHSKVSPELIAHAWKRLTFTDAIGREAFETFLKSAQKAGFLTDAGDLGHLVEIPK